MKVRPRALVHNSSNVLFVFLAVRTILPGGAAENNKR